MTLGGIYPLSSRGTQLAEAQGGPQRATYKYARPQGGPTGLGGTFKPSAVETCERAVQLLLIPYRSMGASSTLKVGMSMALVKHNPYTI